MQITFKAMSEEQPGEEWEKAFRSLWPGYKVWFLNNGGLEGLH